ncbi:MAG: hypothetical protein QOC65_172 [Sphingomonadales bacterium]|nr:hypothetical protein [Sphingomonadales bacterium]
MAKEEATVEELVSMIERGELRLPEMQRQYVWQGPRVRDLLDSLYRGYPSGAILIWETDEEIAQRDMAIAQSKNPYQATRLLLDGQQRLTSLAAVVRGKPVKVRGRQRPIDILFNLEHPEKQEVVTEVEEDGEDDPVEADETDSSEDELQRRFDKMTFVVATNKLASLPQWVRVSDVFRESSNRRFLKDAGIKDYDDPRGEKYENRLTALRKIKDYSYRMDVLKRDLSYEEVTEIFVRVNSLGAKLRSSDLALAQITAKWRHSLDTFQEFQARCAKLGFDLDLGIHLKALVAFATGQSRFHTVANLSLDQLQTAWRDATEGIEFAINFLKSNVGIDSPALLSSPFLMIVVAYYGHARGYSLSPEEAAGLRQWALIANTKGRFSRGSSETILDQDLSTIAKGGSASALIDRVRLQFGRLYITEEDLEGRDQRSSLFKTMFLVFRASGAKDWTSNLQISLDHSGVQHRIQFHHFFPKAALTKIGVPSREADDISNLTFISGKTNRKISDKAPSVYLPPIIERQSKELLALQSIPDTSELWELAGYRRFLAERRTMIANRLNDFLGTSGDALIG